MLGERRSGAPGGPGRPCALKSRRACFTRRAVNHTSAFTSLQCRHADVFVVAPREDTVRRDVDVYGAPAAPSRAAHAHLSTNEYLELAGNGWLHAKVSARRREHRRPLRATRSTRITRPAYFCPSCRQKIVSELRRVAIGLLDRLTGRVHSKRSHFESHAPSTRSRRGGVEGPAMRATDDPRCPSARRTIGHACPK